MTVSRQSLNAVAAVAAASMLAFVAWANFGAGDNGGPGVFAVTAAIGLVLIGVLFWWYIPNARRPAAAGLTTALLGLVSVVAFWSGLPFVLGPAAAVLGEIARRRGESPGVGSVALVLGVIAAVAGAAGVLIDQLT